MTKNKRACLTCQNYSVIGSVISKIDDNLKSESNEKCLTKNIILNNLKPVYCNSYKKFDFLPVELTPNFIY